MKRREMLKVIKKVCQSWENCQNTPKMYNEILTAIETAGMLPPKIYKDVNDFALGYSNNPSELIEVYAKNEWEPDGK